MNCFAWSVKGYQVSTPFFWCAQALSFESPKLGNFIAYLTTKFFVATIQPRKIKFPCVPTFLQSRWKANYKNRLTSSRQILRWSAWFMLKVIKKIYRRITKCLLLIVEWININEKNGVTIKHYGASCRPTIILQCRQKGK